MRVNFDRIRLVVERAQHVLVLLLLLAPSSNSHRNLAAAVHRAQDEQESLPAAWTKN